MKNSPDRAKTTMKHILAMNKNPTVGLKNGNQPPRGISKVTAFAKGGKVKAKVVVGQGKSASKADGERMKDANGAKFASGGKACAKGGKVKLASGGAAKQRKKSPMPKPIKKGPYVNGG